MAAYGIGDLEKLLGVKAHVIRYWEKEIPLIQSRRDLNGRRVYAKRDLSVFFRLKYLLYNRRFTIEGARDQLFRELTGEGDDHSDTVQNLKAHIEALRGGLLDLYSLVHEPTGSHEPTDSHKPDQMSYQELLPADEWECI